jgi:ABC-type uncharacterized transport system substrate-binding protein
MRKMMGILARLAGGALLAAAALPGAAAAHPHVWIDARSEVIFDDQQRMTALRVSWRFDEFYSVFAIEGLDKNGDGELAPAELRPLAELNVTNLKEYRYFTEIVADGGALAYGPVSDYESRYEEGILTLEFTIPLAAPVDPRRARVAFKSYDPTFYIAIEPALQDPVSLAGTPPASCRAVVEEGSGPSETFSLSEAGSLSDAGALDPNVNEGLGALYATTIVLACAPAEAPQ